MQTQVVIVYTLKLKCKSLVTDDMKSFIEYCQTTNDNKCFHGTFKDITKVVTMIVDNRQTITGYSYSEYIGVYL